MNRFTWPLGIVIVTGMASAFAQPGPPGGSSRGGPAGGPRGGPGSPGGAVPPMPVIEVLDADHNHVISAGELKNATSALLTLDKNRDGQLTENEFGPQAAGAMGRGQARPIGNGRKVGGATSGQSTREQLTPQRTNDKWTTRGTRRKRARATTESVSDGRTCHGIRHGQRRKAQS